MKVILGDNQFFGINHFDLNKAEVVRDKFKGNKEIIDFIKNAINLGMDGYMINSNSVGVSVVESMQNEELETELHYSMPYPHKYATLVNEIGLFGLLAHFLRSFKVKNISSLIKFTCTFNLRYLLPVIVELELPRNIKSKSHIYLQNIVVDLLLGMPKANLFFRDYAKYIIAQNHVPGFITMNLEKLVKSLELAGLANLPLVICFNINKVGFNVFPNNSEVFKTVDYIRERYPKWRLMGMSILASGSMRSEESLRFEKLYSLDYLVFGSSKLENIKSNIEIIKSFKA